MKRLLTILFLILNFSLLFFDSLFGLDRRQLLDDELKNLGLVNAASINIKTNDNKYLYWDNIEKKLKTTDTKGNASRFVISRYPNQIRLRLPSNNYDYLNFGFSSTSAPSLSSDTYEFNVYSESIPALDKVYFESVMDTKAFLDISNNTFLSIEIVQSNVSELLVTTLDNLGLKEGEVIIIKTNNSQYLYWDKNESKLKATALKDNASRFKLKRSASGNFIFLVLPGNTDNYINLSPKEGEAASIKSSTNSQLGTYLRFMSEGSGSLDKIYLKLDDSIFGMFFLADIGSNVYGSSLVADLFNISIPPFSVEIVTPVQLLSSNLDQLGVRENELITIKTNDNRYLYWDTTESKLKSTDLKDNACKFRIKRNGDLVILNISGATENYLKLMGGTAVLSSNVSEADNLWKVYCDKSAISLNKIYLEWNTKTYGTVYLGPTGTNVFGDYRDLSIPPFTMEVVTPVPLLESKLDEFLLKDGISITIKTNDNKYLYWDANDKKLKTTDVKDNASKFKIKRNGNLVILTLSGNPDTYLKLSGGVVSLSDNISDAEILWSVCSTNLSPSLDKIYLKSNVDSSGATYLGPTTQKDIFGKTELSSLNSFSVEIVSPPQLSSARLDELGLKDGVSVTLKTTDNKYLYWDLNDRRLKATTTKDNAGKFKIKRNGDLILFNLPGNTDNYLTITTGVVSLGINASNSANFWKVCSEREGSLDKIYFRWNSDNSYSNYLGQLSQRDMFGSISNYLTSYFSLEIVLPPKNISSLSLSKLNELGLKDGVSIKIKTSDNKYLYWDTTEKKLKANESKDKATAFKVKLFNDYVLLIVPGNPDNYIKLDGVLASLTTNNSENSTRWKFNVQDLASLNKVYIQWYLWDIVYLGQTSQTNVFGDSNQNPLQYFSIEIISPVTAASGGQSSSGISQTSSGSSGSASQVSTSSGSTSSGSTSGSLPGSGTSSGQSGSGSVSSGTASSGTSSPGIQNVQTKQILTQVLSADLDKLGLKDGTSFTIKTNGNKYLYIDKISKRLKATSAKSSASKFEIKRKGDYIIIVLPDKTKNYIKLETQKGLACLSSNLSDPGILWKVYSQKTASLDQIYLNWNSDKSGSSYLGETNIKDVFGQFKKTPVLPLTIELDEKSSPSTSTSGSTTSSGTVPPASSGTAETQTTQTLTQVSSSDLDKLGLKNGVDILIKTTDNKYLSWNKTAKNLKAITTKGSATKFEIKRSGDKIILVVPGKPTSSYIKLDLQKGFAVLSSKVSEAENLWKIYSEKSPSLNKIYLKSNADSSGLTYLGETSTKDVFGVFKKTPAPSFTMEIVK